jgi:hypothetical protein
MAGGVVVELLLISERVAGIAGIKYYAEGFFEKNFCREHVSVPICQYRWNYVIAAT